MKILITGATGLVGKNLCSELLKRGHNLILVSRNAEKAKKSLSFNCEIIETNLLENPIDKSYLTLLNQTDAVINLMGEPIAEGKWTNEKKQALIDSRVKATRNLRLSFIDKYPKILISASAIGIYGSRGDTFLDESSPMGKGFLSQLCSDWEREALSFSNFGTQVAIIRIGIILTNQGGALAKMLPPFRAGVGGKLGNGSQWMSWIHLTDLIDILCFLLEHQKAQGIFNAVSPSPVTNSDFTKILSQLLKRPAILHVPKLILDAIFGEKAQLLTDSQRVFPKKLSELGYHFKFESLDRCLKKELSLL